MLLTLVLRTKRNKLIVSRDVIFNEHIFPYASTTNPVISNKEVVSNLNQNKTLQTNQFFIEDKFEVEPELDRDLEQP